MMNLEKEFEKFQKRKQFLQHACKYSRDVYTMAKSMTHEERINLQKEIQTMEEPKTDEKCIPALPNKEMFYFFSKNQIEKWRILSKYLPNMYNFCHRVD